jgi:hypothetical protein
LDIKKQVAFNWENVNSAEVLQDMAVLLFYQAYHIKHIKTLRGLDADSVSDMAGYIQ